MVRTLLLLITMHLLRAHTTRADLGTSKSTSRSRQYYFITTLCRGTTYPNLCYDTLSQYADVVGSNHWKLCNRALWTTLQTARNSTVLVYGLSNRHGLSKSEAEVVGVCVENVLDGADRVRQSMRAMGVGRLNKSNFEWQMSNVKTWMSAVITDMVTCSDAFDEVVKVNPDLETRVTGSVDKVEKLASNALSLINTLTVRLFHGIGYTRSKE